MVCNVVRNGDCYIGGICGYSVLGTIINCANKANLKSEVYHYFPYFCGGGIVGGADGVTVNACYNNGNITLDSFSEGYAGGICGRVVSYQSKQGTHIADCYNTGNINGTKSSARRGWKSAGISAEYNSLLNLRNCYNIGNIGSTPRKANGGIVGVQWSQVSASQIQSCYYLDSSCDEEPPMEGWALSEDQMRAQTAYNGFDFDNVWSISPSGGYLYPQLRTNRQTEGDLCNHSFSIETISIADCENEGLANYNCPLCGYAFVSITAPLGHVFGEWHSVTVPSCTESGEDQRECSRCDKVESKEVDPLGHIEQQYASEPTCTEAGFSITICTRCGDTLNKVILSKLDHTWNEGEVTQQPTCTEKGVVTYTCTGCGETKTAPVDMLAHQWNDGEVTKEPSCTEAGEMTYTCAIGGETRTEPIDKLEHEIVLVEGTAPTCTETGLTDGWKCENCGKVFAAQREIPATGHSEVIDPAVPATCLESGLTEGRHCAVCGKVLETQNAVDALGHDWDNGKLISKPNCTFEGRTFYTCMRAGCDATEYRTLPVEPNAHELKKQSFARTCTNDGYTLYSCAYCDYTRMEDVAPAWGHIDPNGKGFCIRCRMPFATCADGGEHTWTLYHHVEAACGVDGYDTMKCTICGVLAQMNYIKMDSHKWGSWQAPSDYKCTVGGEIYRFCTVCGAKEKSSMKAGNHPWEYRDIKAATCSAEGEIQQVCPICNSVGETMAIPRIAHEWGKMTLVSGNCASGGKATHECTVCHTREEVTFAAGKHPEEALKTIPGTPPTCTEKGKTDEIICEFCGTVIQPANHIPPFGHVFVWTELNDATCIENAHRKGICTVCGTEVTEEIPNSSTGDHTDADNDGHCDTCEQLMTGGDHCKYCGQIHGGAFGWLTKFFHSILALFGARK